MYCFRPLWNIAWGRALSSEGGSKQLLLINVAVVPMRIAGCGQNRFGCMCVCVCECKWTRKFLGERKERWSRRTSAETWGMVAAKHGQMNMFTHYPEPLCRLSRLIQSPHTGDITVYVSRSESTPPLSRTLPLHSPTTTCLSLSLSLPCIPPLNSPFPFLSHFPFYANASVWSNAEIRNNFNINEPSCPRTNVDKFRKCQWTCMNSSMV